VIVLNVDVRTRLSLGALALVAIGVLPACGGGEQYRYLESDDGHLFAKIPNEWSVTREGAIDYKLLTFDNMVNFGFVSGDKAKPWRAEFAAPGASGEAPSGYVETQHIDARWRDTFLLKDLIATLRAAADDLERTRVVAGDYEGYRVTYTQGEGDELRRFDEVYLVDERRSALYFASLNCSEDCHDRYGDEIDEVLTTMRVEP
jgi:hypothetical protein